LSLSKARFRSWHVAPLLDNGLLDLPWVGARPGADFLGDVNALLSWLEQGNQFGHMLALLLWFQVAGLLWHLRDNGLTLLEALLWAWLELTAGWAAQLTWHLLTFGFWGVLLDVLLLRCALLSGPLGTLLLSGVTLGDIFTLLVIDSFAVNNIILNIMFVISGLTLGFVDSLTFYWTLAITDKWGVAGLNLLIRGNFFVFDEAVLDKVLLTLLFLLWLEVSGVGGVALLTVAVLACNDIIVLGLFNHDDLVNASLTSSSDGSNVQRNFIVGTLTGSTGWQSKTGTWSLVVLVVVVFMVVFMLVYTPASLLAEWEDSSQILAIPLLGRSS